ncbi:DNA replication/repair protein RecF [Salegentibacter mishustinae]|uniref:DNA replication and repair protein RecF n=1 Tax=Salegentibacter mishustinae TaxID=270918 RepID=A0A0Q9ZJA6_9FLAO|nr:DNA replication/repair protein RecF [Salegentibacter mishustinae]KRG29236.1 DNA recombination protein RecF [Salegentibacter mishustinae]PNW21715.1 DNA recombination protein RecF [Salegentibacter mishustinae]PZX65054.1 DNA replication and repair protein RecF [Salegentibacter mishustinae]GGW87589.1 DNA replication and repair protein RecF [Salegentibacter mishustinae]
MFLKHLSLVNYKNLDSASFEFDTKINCFIGNNGVGKTNVLDSIYHLAFGKSYFNPITSQNINHDADFFVVEGQFEKLQKEEQILVSAKRGQKKVIKRNNKPYEKFSEHIGFIPTVIISPADRDLIIEGSETRRKFMDGVISQSDNVYLNKLIQYGKINAQRNSLLKYFAANHSFDRDTLEVYNLQLSDLGQYIFEKRKAFLEEFIPIFNKRYADITKNEEQVDISYKSQLFDSSLASLLEANLQKDMALQYTSVGTHKDDLSFEIEGHPIKKFGSQGQQKSFLVALKLAQFDFIKAISKVNPILLLDDIFDKLDEQRVAHIVALVATDQLGQIFISDTHADRTEAVVKSSKQSYKLFKL